MKKELIFMLGAAVLGTVCFSNITADKVSAKTSGDYKYVITGKKQKTCAIRKYTGKDKDVVVPAKLDGYTVTRIGNKAFFRNSKIESVKLPKRVTVIGENAFSVCANLKSVNFPSKLHTIKKHAFSSCYALKTLELPDSVKKIGEDAFFKCFDVESIRIPKNLEKADINLFYYTRSAKTITVSKDNKHFDSRDNCNAVIETSTNTLVLGSSNTTIPDSVTSIGRGAFYENETIKEITIPKSVRKIEEGAFDCCINLETVNFSEGLTKIEKVAFNACHSLKEIKLPDSVETIGKNAFSYCDKADSIYIPKNLGKTYLPSVFSCDSVTKISVADGNKFYDSRDNCNAVIETGSNKLVLGAPTSSIPDSVTAIGKYAFFYLKTLKEITIPASVKTIEDGAFSDCSILETVNFPEGLTKIEKGAFNACHSLKEIKLPDSVETIGEDAFYSCDNVSSIYIPKNLGKTDLPSVFSCTSVTKISVADGNKYYDSRNNCNGVIETASNTLVLACKDTVIPNSVKTIGKDAFQNNDSEIVIPEGVENLAYSDYSIEKLTLPKSLKQLGTDNDYNLETINYRGSKAQWKKIKISDPDNLKDVKINYNYKG